MSEDQPSRDASLATSDASGLSRRDLGVLAAGAAVAA